MNMISLLLAGLAYAGSICNDGWISNSSGSGTCSHHGGIATYPSVPSYYSPPVRLPPPLPLYPNSAIPFGSPISVFKPAYQNCEKMQPYDQDVLVLGCDGELGYILYLFHNSIYFGKILVCDSDLHCKEWLSRLADGMAVTGLKSFDFSSTVGTEWSRFWYDQGTSTGGLTVIDHRYVPVSWKGKE